MAMMPNPILLQDIYEPCSCPTRKCRCGSDKVPQVGDEVDVQDLNSYPRVFSVDPGTHTGWAVSWFDPDILFDSQQKVSKATVAWQGGLALGPEMNQVDFLIHKIRKELGGEGLAVVCEDFIVRTVRMERTFLSPVRIGHMLAYGLRVPGVERDGRRRSRQIAAWASSNDALNTITDSRLKLWQMYQPGADHPRDALRHGQLWLRRLKGGGEGLYNEAHFVDSE